MEIVIGSESDECQTGAGLKELKGRGVPFVMHVISCHRNPDALRQYAESIDPATAVVIAGAGKLAALSGVLHSWLVHYKKGHIPVVGVGLRGKSSMADFAAVLAQEELPGQPVILNGNGRAYFGPDGFCDACIDATVNEFLAPTTPSKEAKFNIAVND
jgi:phosphoribosylcarboxyaminoimidazole (NCAIR) mutase